MTTTLPAPVPAVAAQTTPDLLAERLRLLGLTSLARELPQLLAAAHEAHPAYDSFLEQAVELERHGRAQRAYERRWRAAHLPTLKSLDAFDFSFQPTLSERQCLELATLNFVQTATNVVLLGPPGVGKTHPPHYPSGSHVLADRCGHGH
jgi:DNA replication protein DnaC